MARMSEIPTRSQVVESDTWDLKSLYASPEAWECDFEELQAEYPRLGEFRGKLIAKQPILELLHADETLERRVERLAQYAQLKLSEDSADTAALERMARLQGCLALVGAELSFFQPELMALDDATFQSLLDDADFAPWHVMLKKLRRKKPHTLSTPEERLLALAAPALGASDEIYTQLADVDMKYGKVRDEVGVERDVTQSSLSEFLEMHDRRARREAFDSFYKEVGEHSYTLSAALHNSVRGDVFQARARNHASAREASLFSDNVPVAVYDNLISSVRSRLPALFRYYDLRKRVMGLDTIHYYDTRVSLVPDIKIQTSWDEAVTLVLDALAPLGSEYVETLARGLREERWCDRYENKGKHSGAFSYGTYSGHPYILMNYKADVFTDVSTLAHEAGHSMHSLYSRRTQNFQNYHYPIFLAEVASTFNEMLLTEHLLRRTDDPAMRAYIISREVDEFRGTLYRQTMFAEFEMRIHAAEEAGEGLTLDSFRKIYRALLDDYFGSNFAVDDTLELECLRIPHFYRAFYVYKYATGISAAAALAANVLKTGDTSRYIAFLSSGCSEFPIDTLARAGVDMLSPTPVLAALDLFERRVAELEELLPALK